MIKDVKAFLDDFILLELEARNAIMKPNLEDANAKIDKLHSFVASELINSFDVIKRNTPFPDAIYKRFDHSKFHHQRHIYKITEYKNSEFGHVYYCYISNFNPPENFFILYECFVIASINDQYKIILKALKDDEKHPWEWSLTGNSFSFHDPGKLLKIERYLEPKNDSLSMEIFIRNA